jgi:hypothetical protein
MARREDTAPSAAADSEDSAAARCEGAAADVAAVPEVPSTDRREGAAGVVPSSAAPSAAWCEGVATGVAADPMALSAAQRAVDVQAPVNATVAMSSTAPHQEDDMPLGSRTEYEIEGTELIRKAFLKNVVRQATALLQAPATNEPRNRIPPAVSTLRHSRWIAGAGVEFQMGEMARRSTKKVMKTLNIIGESDGVNQQVQEQHSKIFSEPLSSSHLQALAALFGWSSLDSNGLENHDMVMTS